MRRKRKASSIDVARRAGLSRTTVSYVLNGRTDVSIPEATRQRVRVAAAELGYRPHGIARSLVSGNTQTVGVIVPALERSFTADVVNGIEVECAVLNYRLLLVYSHNDAEVEGQQAQLLLEHRVDGVVCVAGEHSIAGTDSWLAEALAEQVACVVVDDSTSELPVDYVVSDDRNGAMTAVAHLIRLGHRRIAHLCAVKRSSPARERRDGYQAALMGAGLEVDEELIVGETFDPGRAAAGMAGLLDLPDPPTAVFAANDYMAAAAIEMAEKRGRRVPGDLAVVGFSDFGLAEYLHLTTVRRSPRHMGKRAVERLFARIENPHLPQEGIVVPTNMIVRESCGGGANSISPGAEQADRAQ